MTQPCQLLGQSRSDEKIGEECRKPIERIQIFRSRTTRIFGSIRDLDLELLARTRGKDLRVLKIMMPHMTLKTRDCKLLVINLFANRLMNIGKYCNHLRTLSLGKMCLMIHGSGFMNRCFITRTLNRWILVT